MDRENPVKVPVLWKRFSKLKKVLILNFFTVYIKETVSEDRLIYAIVQYRLML